MKKIVQSVGKGKSWALWSHTPVARAVKRLIGMKTSFLALILWW